MSDKPTEQDKLRKAAEAKLARAYNPKRTPPSAEKLLHELQVHQIELEMQNEELQRSQRALEESRDHYLDFYDFAPVGYLTLTREGMIAEINLTCAAMLGLERNKLLQQRLERFISLEDRDRFNQHFLEAFKHDDRKTFEVTFKRHDGSSFYAQLNCRSTIKNSTGPIVRIVLTDITELKEAEDNLRTLSVVFESKDPILITDAHANILRANQKFLKITGYNLEEIIGKNPRILQSERFSKKYYKKMWDQLLRNGSWEGEVRIKDKQGHEIPIGMIITAVKNEHQETTHYVAIYNL